MKNTSNFFISRSRIKYFSSYLFFIILLGTLLPSACSWKDKALMRFTVTERAGTTRQLDYVEIEIDVEQAFDASLGISIREMGLDSLWLGQIIGQQPLPSGMVRLRCLFPVTLEANASKTFEVVHDKGVIKGETLKIEGVGVNLKIENEYFVADLSDRKATPDNGLRAGQLSGLYLKQFDGQLLERSHINMHWAPNFQREELDYKTFGHIQDADSVNLVQGPYYAALYRSGHVDGYNEIQVSYRYEFFAGLPYFIFSSDMEMREDINLFLLRNDEMTMDSLFTHVMYFRPDGKMNVKALYDDTDMKAMEDNPIEDDAPWLAFFNNTMNYGFGSIRMEYDNSNLGGGQSPLVGAHTKITSSVNNGRYWNRRLVHDQDTKVPAGSKYYEKNAYLVFKAIRLAPSQEMIQYANRIGNPLEVEYLADE